MAKRVILVVLSLLTIAGVWQWRHAAGRRPAPENPVDNTTQAAATSATTTAAVANPTTTAPSDLIADLISRLDPRQPNANQELLAALHRQLRALPADAAVRLIIAYLKSGQDIATGLRFQIGPGGSLASSPTLRVALLDWLGELDPAAAAEWAKNIFSTASSADEWAIALRNYYRQSGPTDPYFIARVQDLFSNQAWIQARSAGLMESLDFVVAIGGPQGFSLLQGILQNSPPLRRPGLMGLDAWVQTDPHDNIPLLAGQSAPGNTTTGLDERSRAALLSRADVRDPAQRDAVLAYLDAASVPDQAKTAFLRQFPNQNKILGYRLATQPHATPLENIAQQDAASLTFIDATIQSGKYSTLATVLAETRDRVARFVDSAKAGGKL